MIRRIGICLVVVFVTATTVGCPVDEGSGEPDAAPTASASPSMSASPAASPFAAPDFAMLVSLFQEESLAELGLDPTPPEDPDTIASPGFTWVLHETVVTDELDPQRFEFIDYPEPPDQPAEPLLAGPDREFLLALMRPPTDAPRPDAGDANVRLGVRVEGQPFQQLGERERFALGGALVVVSVPVGGDAVLEINDIGSMQRAPETYSLDLRTGKLESGEVSVADGLCNGDVTVSDAFLVSGITPPDQGEGVNFGVDVDPGSHYGSRGSASDGHMWLEVEVTVTFGKYEDWMIAEHATIEVDLGASVTVVDDDGDPLPLELGNHTLVEPEGYPGGDPPAVVASETEVIEVPDTLRQLTVTGRLVATFTTDDGSELGYQRYDFENVGTIELGEPSDTPFCR